MRAIDADELKKCVLKWLPQDPCGKEEKEMPFETDICVSMLMEIDEQPTIQPEPHWIPVTERLPKEDGNYLVSGKWESGKESVGDCEFSVEDGYFRTAWNFDVLAWCELPEPYDGVTK